MMNQPALIHHRQTWLHFIGGHYKHTDKFLNEAIKSRISRRAPAQQVRGMQFGDRLVLLRYENKQAVYAFAEAQIVGITLNHVIAKEVGERLKAEGKAEYQEASGGGNSISRECGSYMIVGSWVVTAPLADVMDIAMQIAEKKNEKLFVMINAELTSIYENPTYIQPTPKFTRGFIKPIDSSPYTVTPLETVTETTVLAISDYSVN